MEELYSCRFTCRIWRESVRNSDYDDARRSIGEAGALIETTKETWCEASSPHRRRNRAQVA